MFAVGFAAWALLVYASIEVGRVLSLW